MLIEAVLVGAGPVQKLVKKETETTYTMKMVLKKIKYEKDTENVKEGTGDPWTNPITITSMSKDSFDEFKGLELGSKILIDIMPAS